MWPPSFCICLLIPQDSILLLKYIAYCVFLQVFGERSTIFIIQIYLRSLARDYAVKEWEGGDIFGRKEFSGGNFAQSVETVAYGVRIFFEGFDAQASGANGGDEFAKSPEEGMAGMGIGEVLDASLIGKGRVYTPVASYVVDDAFGVVTNFLGGKVGVHTVPVAVKHIGDGVEVNKDKAARWLEDAGDSSRPLRQVGDPMDNAVRGVGNIEGARLPCSFGEPVVDVGSLEAGGYTRVGGELLSKGNSVVADVYTNDAGSQPGKAEGILAGVAEQMDNPQSRNIA